MDATQYELSIYKSKKRLWPLEPFKILHIPWASSSMLSTLLPAIAVGQAQPLWRRSVGWLSLKICSVLPKELVRHTLQ